MAFLPCPSFTRCPVSDGSTLSFCNECFVTVANSRWEFELDAKEQAHICEPEMSEYWKALLEEVRSRNLDQNDYNQRPQESLSTHL